MFQATSIIFAVISIALFATFIGIGFVPHLTTGQRDHLKWVLIWAGITAMIALAFMFAAQASLGTVG